MYDLAPVDDRTQVEEALDEVRPYIESHGGEVTLLEVDDGVVHLQMSGACQGCAGSSMTLRRGIEQRLRERYPGFQQVVAHEPEQLLQIEGLRRPVFEDAGSLADLAVGAIAEKRHAVAVHLELHVRGVAVDQLRSGRSRNDGKSSGQDEDDGELQRTGALHEAEIGLLVHAVPRLFGFFWLAKARW